MFSTGRRAFWRVCAVGRKTLQLREVQSRPGSRWRTSRKVLFVGISAIPVGLHLFSDISCPHLTSHLLPAMADCSTQPPLSEIVAHADELYEANSMREGVQYLRQYEHLNEVEVLWRLARLCYKLGMYQTKDQEEKKKLAEEGWGYIERGLALGGDKHNGCRRWAGILLSWSSEFEGIKKKIEKSFEIKEHFIAAIECDAKDATSMHLLGQWCYSVVSVPWYQRKVASVFFATPPESTYEEALSHFEAAEKVDPGFYMVNWLWIGKCHLGLSHKQEAKLWLDKVVAYDTSLEEELEAKKEAAELLRNL